VPTYKRGGIWYARAQVGNRRIEQSAGAGASQAEAKELEQSLFKRLREDRHAKRVGKSLNRTFGEALLEYLRLPETQNLRSYQSLKSVANLIRPHLENVPLENTPEKAEEMKQVFLAGKLSSSTINRRLALVRRILTISYEKWKWITAPLYVSLLPENNERHIYPEPELVADLAAACPSKDNGDALLVIYFTGMRRSEFIAVNQHPLTYIQKNTLMLYSGFKTKKPRRVPILPAIRHIVKRMPLDVDYESLRYNFETARLAVGRPEMHLHDLRHGFASMIAESGGELIDIMRLLGHTSAQTTQRYTHLLDKRLRTVVGNVGRLAAGKRRSHKSTQRAENTKISKTA
jgi:integrase